MVDERNRIASEEVRQIKEYLAIIDKEGILHAKIFKKSDIKPNRQTVIITDGKNMKATDLIMRLKTTSASSDKYAQALDILCELIEEEKFSSSDPSKLKEPLKALLKQPINYKFIEKGIRSKNQKVAAAAENLQYLVNGGSSA